VKKWRSQPTRLRMFFVILLTAILYVVFFRYVYPEIVTAEANYLLMGFIVLFSIVLVVSFALWLKAYSEEISDVNRKLKHYETILAKETHTFYVSDATKETIILNKDGDAMVRYSFRCRNNPESPLERVRLNITHDGNLIEDSISCLVDGIETPPSEIERLMLIDAESKKPKAPMPSILRFSIRPEKGIRRGAQFSYSYGYRMEELYKDVLKPDVEFTQTLILHPTDRLKTIIKAPEGYLFDSFRVEVLDRDEVAHLGEEERIKIQCPPFLMQDKKTLFWDLPYPSLANIYRLRFSIREE